MPLDRGGLLNSPNSILLFATIQVSQSNVDMDALSQIPWDQNIKANAVEAIFKATVDGPDALMEVYACHERAISSLILESPPTQMTVADCVQAQKVDPAISLVITWLEDKLLGTAKVGKEMSPELRQYLRQKEQLCLQEWLLFRCEVTLGRTVMNSSW